MTGHDVTEHGGEAEREAAWQKHVVVALWILLAVFMVASLALFYGKTRGAFRAIPQDTAAPWPAEWP